jgi:hypothetical protein
MEHYVTLFDSLYLPQGLALHMSMERHVKDYTLWIVCVDNEVHKALSKLKLPNIRLLELSKLETEELIRVKPMRSKGEYCWTLTPFTPKFVFDADKSVFRVTYLDADLWFRKNPKLIFEELENSLKSVLITDHAYAPEHDQSDTSGQYCVQFIIFNRDGGEEVRRWWEKKCLEWCYARFEEDKFGDQKYLDYWPILFNEQVHILEKKELLLAPWNMANLPFGNSAMFHFHGLKIVSRKKIVFGSYGVPYIIYKKIYKPYCEDIKEAFRKIESIGIDYKYKNERWVVTYMKITWIKNLVKKLVRRFHTRL